VLFFSKKGASFFALICVLAAIIVYPSYEGSLLPYIIFHCVWITVVFLVWHKPGSYVFLFSAIFLFLGFWLRLVARLLFNSVGEPTGYWSHSQSWSDWDRVLWVSVCVALGLITANLCFRHINFKSMKDNDSFFIVWYEKYRTLLWLGVFLFAIILGIINFWQCILVTAIPPKLVLPFHLSAAYIWFMAFFLPLFMAFLYGLEKKTKKKHFGNPICMIIVVAFFMSLSFLSRATYLFWTLPLFFASITVASPWLLLLPRCSTSNVEKCRYLNSPVFSLRQILKTMARKTAFYLNYLLRHEFKIIMDVTKKKAAFIFFYCSLGLISVFGVNELRDYYYHPQESFLTTEQSDFGVKVKKRLENFFILFTKRWVGLEGVMATTAYPQKSMTFFLEGLKEHTKTGVGIYNTKVLKPFYNPKNIGSSLPGLAGVLNYSDSLLIVYFGTFFVIFLIIFTERLAFALLKNKYYMSLQALLMSYWCVAGVNTPYLAMVNFIEYLAVLLSIKVLLLCLKKF